MLASEAVLSIGRRRIGFEIKFSSAPSLGKGFAVALDDLQLDHAYVVAPVQRRFPLRKGVDVIPVADVPAVLAWP